MPVSTHSHSGQFCAHASNTLEEMVQAAIAKEMRMYALTEHMPRGPEDLYPEEASKSSQAILTTAGSGWESFDCPLWRCVFQ